MAKRTTSKPQAVAVAQDLAAASGVAETDTDTKIEEATAQAEGSPTPPALGNEGTAAEAGEGQPSLADTAGDQGTQVADPRLGDQSNVRALTDVYPPVGLRVPEDGVTLSDAIRAASDAVVAPDHPPVGDITETVAPSLVVIGPKKGRWRIGRKFGPEPVTLTTADLSIDELEALAADPSLTVAVINAPF